jgi:hypothetical protein
MHTKHTLRDVILTSTDSIRFHQDHGGSAPARTVVHRTGVAACKRALFRSAAAKRLSLPCPWMWTLRAN